MKHITWVNLVLGVWLLFAPFALGVAGLHSAWSVNDIALGALLIFFSGWILASSDPSITADWMELLCGIWLVAAPFALKYSGIGRALSNDVIVGLATITVAMVAVATISRQAPMHQMIQPHPKV
jgi:hypothetical protein